MNNEVERLEEKVIDLETRLAFQEDHLSALNQRLIEQDNELAKLHLQLRHLHDKWKESDTSASSQHDPVSERPPHY